MLLTDCTKLLSSCLNNLILQRTAKIMSSNYESRLLENLSKMLENEAFHDITIGLSEGHNVLKTNKSILCSNSTYFASFFNNNNNLKKNGTNVDIEVPITRESITLVLRFLYTGRMEYESLSLRETLNLLKLLGTRFRLQ